MLKNNGLELIKIKSTVMPIEITKSLKEEIAERIKSDAYVVAYLDYKVLIGRFKNGEFEFYDNEQFEDRFVQRIRIFNKDIELYVWRTNDNSFKGRLRVDNESGEKTDVVDAYQVIFGTKAERLGDYSKLIEERGTELIVPFKDISINDKRKRLFLKTRNYIGYNQMYQAGYIDCRFLEIIDKAW